MKIEEMEWLKDLGLMQGFVIGAVAAVIGAIIELFVTSMTLQDNLDSKSGWRKELFEVASKSVVNIKSVNTLRATLRYEPKEVTKSYFSTFNRFLKKIAIISIIMLVIFILKCLLNYVNIKKWFNNYISPEKEGLHFQDLIEIIKNLKLTDFILIAIIISILYFFSSILYKLYFLSKKYNGFFSKSPTKKYIKFFSKKPTKKLLEHIGDNEELKNKINGFIADGDLKRKEKRNKIDEELKLVPKNNYTKNLVELIDGKEQRKNAITHIINDGNLTKKEKQKKIDEKLEEIPLSIFSFDNVTKTIVEFCDELDESILDKNLEAQQLRIYTRYMLKHHWENLSVPNYRILKSWKLESIIILIFVIP